MARYRSDAWFPAKEADCLLVTGQTTTRHVADDGDYEWGVVREYLVRTAGPFAGTVNLDVSHYAGNQIAFAATTPGTITDVANGLATVLTGDLLVVRGSGLNDGVYNVSTGGVAGTIRTTEATVLEAAGAYVSLAKRAAHSNNYVLDRKTTVGWSRYTSNGERVGPASNGTLVWRDAALVFTLHPAAADLQIIAATSILRIVGGAGEVARYHVGDVIDCAGFANAVNNLTGYVIVSVTVNVADLDIVLNPFNNVLINEAAGGARSIGLVCRSIWNYCAAANVASLGGYTDWRIPNTFELQSIANCEAATLQPDGAAFPGWPGSQVWSSTVRPDATDRPFATQFNGEYLCTNAGATIAWRCALVRGG